MGDFNDDTEVVTEYQSFRGQRNPSTCSSINSKRASITKKVNRTNTCISTAEKQSSVKRAESSRTNCTNANESRISWSTSSCAPSNRYKAKRNVSFKDGLRKGENYQVLMVGAPGVGKTSLIRQFQKSNSHQTTIRVTNVYGDDCERTNDAQLTIIDNPATEISAERAIACCDVDAYVIVYSITDRKSFESAKEIVKLIQNDESHRKKAAIIVGNKADLVRRRDVQTQEGKALATSSGCKFIETSDWIDHELFDGVLAQIRLRVDSSSTSGSQSSNKEKTKEKQNCRRSKTLASNILKDLINLINRNVKQCDNLQVL
ncbi:hypothetical protein CHUAL_005170 [Chamberlinius hualienensis]